MNKEEKEGRAAAAAANVRAQGRRGAAPSNPEEGQKVVPDFARGEEELDPTDIMNCYRCAVSNECTVKVKKDCLVYQATRADIEWFIPFWNAMRLQYKARLPELMVLTGQQKQAIRCRQTRYGVAMVRLFIIKLMTSDFVNRRKGKNAPTHLDYYLEAHRFPKVLQGRYNDPEVIEEPPTAAELRRQRAEEREEARQQRLREAREEEEREHERMEKERERWAREAATPEQIREIMAQFKLPKNITKTESQ